MRYLLMMWRRRSPCDDERMRYLLMMWRRRSPRDDELKRYGSGVCSRLRHSAVLVEMQCWCKGV
jgi:hypothetical protein